jgi:hypothetical protein
MTTRTRIRTVGWTALIFTVTSFTVARGQETPEPPRARMPVGPVASPPVPVPVAAPADPRAALTETVGLLSGLYLHQTYLTLGLLADGRAERLYDERAARAALATVLAPLDAVDRQFAAVGAAAETAADRQAAERLRAVVGLLKRQGQELTAVWDSGHPAAGARYEATRQETWRQINALLGLDRK